MENTANTPLDEKLAALQRAGLIRCAAPQQSGETLSARLERTALDALSHTGDFVAKTGAALASSWVNAKDSFAFERARQEALRIERLHAAATNAGLVPKAE